MSDDMKNAQYEADVDDTLAGITEEDVDAALYELESLGLVERSKLITLWSPEHAIRFGFDADTAVFDRINAELIGWEFWPLGTVYQRGSLANGLLVSLDVLLPDTVNTQERFDVVREAFETACRRIASAYGEEKLISTGTERRTIENAQAAD